MDLDLKVFRYHEITDYGRSVKSETLFKYMRNVNTNET
jgi:hypothetical protein